MNDYNNLKKKYDKLKEEFETYQNFTENTMSIMNEKNIKLEKQLDALVNIVEISKYINSNIGDHNLISKINDMIIGILGVTYSSIYLNENGILKIKATNFHDANYNIFKEESFEKLNNGKPFVVNCKEDLFKRNLGKYKIHSIIGIPIHIRNKLIGYIIVEHSLYDFFGQEHIKFISTIANQIGISLQNNFLYNKVKENSIMDPLMPLYTRKHFFNLVNKKIAENSKTKFALVMIDIDNFKSVNDNYGHQFGDQVLIETAKIINKNVRKYDLVARYGGEEIVIYLEGTYHCREIYNRIDDIREQISNNIVKFGKTEKSVTASFGIGYYPEDGNDTKEILTVADKMLYKAKKTGKNKVICSKEGDV